MLILHLLCLLLQFRLWKRPFARRRALLSPPAPALAPPLLICHGSSKGQRKPDWARRELIRMKAFAPNTGCRVIAQTFNRRFAANRRVTVSKSFVAGLLNQHRAEVAYLRRTIRHRIPRPSRRNSTWGLDLTVVTDSNKVQRLALGIVDHGSRVCIALRELSDKRSLTILRELIRAMRQFGLPRRIRVDNERCLTSTVMRAALTLLGVRLQTIDKHCPWPNGRIERFFGTFKAAIRRIVVAGVDLPHRLIEFRAFYNHARPHQHLDGRTPAEAWRGVAKAHGEGKFIELWSGVLSGWHFPLRE